MPLGLGFLAREIVGVNEPRHFENVSAFLEARQIIAKYGTNPRDEIFTVFEQNLFLVKSADCFKADEGSKLLQLFLRRIVITIGNA